MSWTGRFLRLSIPLCLMLAHCTAEQRNFDQRGADDDASDVGEGSSDGEEDTGAPRGPDGGGNEPDGDDTNGATTADDAPSAEATSNDDDDVGDETSNDDDSDPEAPDDEGDGDIGTDDDDDAGNDDDTSAVSPDDDFVEMSCETGEHYCPEQGCVSDDSTETCGAACEPCVAPVGGVVACDGTSCLALCVDEQQLCGDTCIDPAATCDQSNPVCPEGEDCVGGCPTGYRDCSGTCTLLDDPNACGESCTACPVPENGNALCVNGVCGVECDPDYHACGEECFADTDATHCGAECVECVPPLGGSTECVDDQCRGTCPSGQELCAGTCIAEAAPCDAECPMGTHDCSGDCLSSTSTASCGESCAPCPAPTAGGTATCDGDACGIQCSSGYHQCGDDCAADNDATACGEDCINCPVPSQGLAVCMGGSCGIACSSGYHPCNGECVDNDDVATCGQSCTPCTAPTGGTVSCNGTSCQPACPGGQKLCNNSCIANSAPCNGSCSAGFHACGNECFSDALSAGCDGLSWSVEEGEFGPTNVLESQSFTLKNNSPSPVTDLETEISLLTTPGCSASPNDLWSVASNTCAGTLNSGQTCTVVVDFDGEAVDVGGCFTAELAAEGDQYTARLPLNGDIIGYTWQRSNTLTFSYDTSAPAVGDSCSTAGVERDAQPTEVSNANLYELTFTTNPPSRGGCAAGQYAVSQSTCYEGPSCNGPWEPYNCSLSCISSALAASPCELIYYRLKCVR